MPTHRESKPSAPPNIQDVFLKSARRERLVVQIAPAIWERAWAQSGLPRHVWSGDPVILDTDAVTQWDFRGLLERMAQTVYLDEPIRSAVQCCEVTELILLFCHVIHGRRAAPPTVYRALDFLLENSLVHRIASLNAFMGCSHPEHAHQGQFLICRQCHVAIELEQASISDAIVASANDVGFSVETQTVEVVGLCGTCRSA